MINYIASFLYTPSVDLVEDLKSFSKVSSRFNTYEDRMATLIQKIFRGYSVRQGYLTAPSYSIYKECVFRILDSKHTVPVSIDGDTRVYFPEECPEIILKKSGRMTAIKRFHQMQDVRSILRLQRSSRLSIPKAALYEWFLVEQRMPINTSCFYNMKIYTAEPHLFDEAIRELTRLFSEVHLEDLISSQAHQISNIVCDIVRSDNLPLYIEETNGKRIGKIALIDLEMLRKEPRGSNFFYGFCAIARFFRIKAPYCGLSSLVRIFPYHKDLIIEEAVKLNMPINRLSLNIESYRGEEYLKEGYLDHYNWIKRKGPSEESKIGSFEIGQARKNKIINLIEKELLRLNQGNNDLYSQGFPATCPTSHFLGENPKKRAEQLAPKIGSILIKNIKKEIEKGQDNILKAYEGIIESDPEILDLRAFGLYRKELYKGLTELFPLIDYKQLTLDQILQTVFAELVKGQEVFSFDLNLKDLDGEICWIRF